MWIKVNQDTLIGGQWTGVGKGNFSPNVAEHLIGIGVAESLETKIDPPTEQKKSPSSVSQPAQASPESKPKRRRGRTRKSSSLTMHGNSAQKPSTSTPAMKDGGDTIGNQ